jgi:TonB family protein
MGKVVKYCAKCEEGFAERFGFCPNCGLELQAFEMNPLKAETRDSVPAIDFKAEKVEVKTPEPQTVEATSKVEEPVAANVPATMAFSDDEILDLDFKDSEEVVVEEPEPTKPFIPAVTAAGATIGANGNGNGYKFQQDETVSGDSAIYNFSSQIDDQKTNIDEDYHVTVIEEKNVTQRNGLLLAFSAIAIFAVSVAMVWSIFANTLGVDPLDQSAAILPPGLEVAPVEIEEEAPKKNDDEGGGGGGGGKENPEPVTKGRLPTQVPKPQNPLMMVTQMTNPTIVVRNETQGNIVRPKTNEINGLPSGLSSDRLSSGGGTGGGFGDGNGSGAGNGRGTGEGSGIGSGSGNGFGNGNGDGRGDGDNGDNTPRITKVEKPVGISKGVTITSKPRANYTDSARQNQVQGTVTLRVTFNANGSIGSVSAVSGLPYGLTEQAIAAAKQIRFEPAMKNGQAVAVTKQVQYSFTIY